MNRTWAIAVLALGAMAMTAGAAETPAAPARVAPAAAVPRLPAAETPGRPPAVETTGRGFVEVAFTQPARTVQLAAAVGGIIMSKDADEGAVLKSGETLMTLDNRTEAVAVRAATLEAEDKSEEEAARATMEQADYEAKITKQLSAEGAEAELLFHQKEMAAEVAKYKYALAKKNRQRAGLELEAAKIALDRKIIRTPVAGLVTRMPKEAGEAVQPLEMVAQIAVTDPLYIITHPPAQMLGTFRVGQTLDVEILEPKPQTITVKVAVVNPVVDPASNTFRVRLAIPNPEGKIPAGVKVRVRVEGPESLKGP